MALTKADILAAVQTETGFTKLESGEDVLVSGLVQGEVDQRCLYCGQGINGTGQ